MSPIIPGDIEQFLIVTHLSNSKNSLMCISEFSCNVYGHYKRYYNVPKEFIYFLARLKYIFIANVESFLSAVTRNTNINIINLKNPHSFINNEIIFYIVRRQ